MSRDEDDAEDHQFGAGGRMHEQLDAAFDEPNAIQVSGPIILSLITEYYNRWALVRIWIT